jgi:hypothetical protein
LNTFRKVELSQNGKADKTKDAERRNSIRESGALKLAFSKGSEFSEKLQLCRNSVTISA